MITARQATLEDAVYVGTNLRESDRLEVLASCGSSPLEAVVTSFKTSLKSWCVVDAGRPVFIFGLALWPDDTNVGIPWMLATDHIEKCPRAYSRKGLEFVNEMQSMFPVLTNCTDERNTKIRRWLGWMGFKELQVIHEYGVGKKPFVQFVRYRDHHV